ncbi:MAG: IclR family transcriptional regulator [Dehalobacterium sp.]
MTTKRISILQQAVDVLDCFTGENSSLSLADLNTMLEIPKSTIHRIVISLLDAGALNYDQKAQQYSLGVKVLKWGGNFLNRLKIQDVVHSYLESFRDQTGETATLTILVGTRRMYLDQVESNSEMRMSVELGKLLPLHAGANGKAILAFAGQELFDKATSEHCLQSLTATTITNKDDLRNELRKVREEGFAVSCGERVFGSVSVAAPLFSISGELVGTIGLSGPANRFTFEKAREWGPLISRTAKEISRTVVWYNAITV